MHYQFKNITNNQFDEISELRKQMDNLTEEEWKAIVNDMFTELEGLQSQQLDNFLEKIENLTHEEWEVLKNEALINYEKQSFKDRFKEKFQEYWDKPGDPILHYACFCWTILCVFFYSQIKRYN